MNKTEYEKIIAGASFKSTHKTAVRFSLTAENLAVLLSGNMVVIDKARGGPVEFFLKDIGVNECNSIFELSTDLFNKRFGGKR